jgi:rfaE bifunctional protein kinase chain/domain
VLDIEILHSLQQKSALVIGDFMLDVYTRGHVQRISPEAPVPVLCVEEENHRPGGAGNAILNLVSLGMKVKACGRVGNDWSGKQFVAALEFEQVDCSGIFTDSHFETPVKKRMIADHQQLLRVDYENPKPIRLELEETVLKQLPQLLHGIDIVAISDYAKGFLSDHLLASIINEAKKRNIPVIVDPKGTDFKKYDGATILKPNLGEAYAAAGFDRRIPLELVGSKILQELNIQTLMITRSKEGITLFSNQGREDYPAFVHEVKDVTGAGDTVLAVIALAKANDLHLNIGATLANVAAGIAIERIGCARITIKELSERLADLQRKSETIKN